jgi:ribA/ribD-fused uncharacterized protein
MSKIINFYTTKGEHGYFSNFSRYPVKIKGKIWPTTEHYFQAMKFEGTVHEAEIRKADNPMQAAQMGRDRKRPLRTDWEIVKNNIMKEAIRAKFTQHSDLKNKLLSTNGSILVEHTVNDKYWGDGGDGSGKNMLGKILMEVRDELNTLT